MLRKALLLVLPAGVIAAALLVRLSTAHQPPAQRAFYYWKTEWSGAPALTRTLASNGIQRLYMRFFDVEPDAGGFARPVAELRMSGPAPSGVDVVPVVYITNSVFLDIPYADVERLANRVYQKIAAMSVEYGLRFDELQVDCDWSDGSRRSYFHFVDLIARRAASDRRSVSTTIRLHQVKYFQRTGVPPAARGMLMFYNFGRIEAEGPGNSIFSEEDAARYARYIADYPLSLDVVLPAFSWSVHSREGRVLGLLEHVTAADVASFDGFRFTAPGELVARRSFFFRGRYFMAGDRLRMETVTPGITREAARMAKEGAGRRKPYGTVALFDLDDRRSSVYSDADITNILSVF